MDITSRAYTMFYIKVQQMEQEMSVLLTMEFIIEINKYFWNNNHKQCPLYVISYFIRGRNVNAHTCGDVVKQTSARRNKHQKSGIQEEHRKAKHIMSYCLHDLPNVYKQKPHPPSTIHVHRFTSNASCRV